MGLRRVLELYSGIGGMHFALERLGQPYEVVAAMEINSTVLETYAHNFPETPACNRNILSLSANEINLLRIDLIVLSPPCQPFCRSGLQKDTEDARTDSFCHILKILPEVTFQYILLENVKGFETSEAHAQLLECLGKCGFRCQEFLITPTTVGIPNSRLRYYLLGKRADLPWCFATSEEILTKIPGWGESGQGPSSCPYAQVVRAEQEIWEERRKKLLLQYPSFPTTPFCVGDILDSFSANEEGSSKSSVSQAILQKYYEAMDIVSLHSTSTCCFTTSYGTFVKGTGSILDENSLISRHDATDGVPDERKLRFFSPTEVRRLMCFPDSFTFPPHISVKQQYKALGNSVNVFVVSILLSLLLGDA